MSDIQDLIHKTTMDCLERGRREEQERIIKLLEERKCGCYCEVHMVLDPAIAAIKGEK